MSDLISSLVRRQREDAYLLREVWRQRETTAMTLAEIVHRMETLGLFPSGMKGTEKLAMVIRLLSRRGGYWILSSPKDSGRVYFPNPVLLDGKAHRTA